ncbi:L-fucose:H+ symporter permease [Melioribacter sp. OK-6-Me]|uniref:L-fucose:H+ symporter permease n=1 Tax=unclassified Melioribacter TaxID=2627329 RepID=UPI003ED8A1EF
MNGKFDKSTSPSLVQRNHLIPFILITSCFAWWGLANNMTDTLLAAFKRIMSLSDFQTSWIQIAFYGSYFCLALPAALFIKKFTYKAGVLLGLGLFIAGALLFYPASKTMNYYHFLLALYILAGGLSILETSANPYVIVMGEPSTATRRLNLAQSFNPVGSIAGVIISQLFILSQLNHASSAERLSMAPEQLKRIQSAELSAVMGPYVGVAIILLLLWIVIALTKMPLTKDEVEYGNVKQSVKRLLRNKNYLLGVTAQFFYVGAQIGVWSFTIRYVMRQLELNEKNAATFYLISLILFALFRFICTGLMKYVSPAKLLVYLSGIAAVLTFTAIVSRGYMGVIALVSISACMSLMFPTIFGLAVEGLKNDTQIASSGLIMAILGGAVLTALQGLMSDLTSNINFSYIIPFICFLIILYYGLYVVKQKKKISIPR